MPTMQEIYQSHSKEYDELVTREDHEGNLQKTLNSIAKFDGKSILELGTGTGRVTKLYTERAGRILCCDKSAHMIGCARKNLAPWAEKIDFLVVDTLNVPITLEKYDVILEGWSFGHIIPEDSEAIPRTTQLLVSCCEKNLKSGGTIIIIETLGTNVDTPNPPKELLGTFFKLLEDKHGFQKKVISTDYKFPSNEEASRVMGFFFGDIMKESVKKRGSSVIPEFTGIWYKKLLSVEPGTL